VSIRTAISACFSNYATFSGRASRSEFWWFNLFATLMCWGASVVGNLQGITTGSDLVAVWLPNLVSLAFTLPLLAVGSRRLHDIGKSGWWQLLALTIVGLIPLIIWFATPSRGVTAAAPVGKRDETRHMVEPSLGSPAPRRREPVDGSGLRSQLVRSEGLVAKTVYCRDCGHRLHETALICQNCGAPQPVV
jgi:uncharacterized membrane protein YhaH (DUF805 family)